MDIILAMLPWWFINRRSLNKKERLGVKIAMSMGVLYVCPTCPEQETDANDKSSVPE